MSRQSKCSRKIWRQKLSMVVIWAYCTIIACCCRCSLPGSSFSFFSMASWILSRISEAAALVNVITSSLSISPGLSPSVIIRMIRSTRTAVFPLPAAAETRRFLSLLSITCLCSFVQFTPMTLHCLRFRLPDRLCLCGSLFCLLRFCFPLPPPQSPPRLPPVSLP